jgi:adenine/guanine phosphoribosyltransferase-like PRPP-binding protein
MNDNHRYLRDGKIIAGAGHTTILLNHKERNKIVMSAVKVLKKYDFDSIACCGTSGLLVVPQIAEILDKHIVVIRKPSEKRYSVFDVEGVVPSNYIIVDDLVCSGRTIRLIRNSIKSECTLSKCVGAYFYLPEECAYSGDNGQALFQRDYGFPALNSFPVRV